MSIGDIPDIDAGNMFESRRDLYEKHVHRTLRGGIVGSEKHGAESIVLSGGYVDDADYGDVIIYTGQGGRDANTGRQIEDQDFVGGNKALVTSCNLGLPVRVVRGNQHKGDYSPEHGYRYDGLFRVDSYWSELGKDGFRICRFRLVFIDGGVVDFGLSNADEDARGKRPKRSLGTIQRIVRDTALGRHVKEIHNYTCQICGLRLDCVGGPYAEAAHIRPLGEPHNGPDEISNLLCLCPNHHVLLDRGALTIDDDLIVQPIGLPLKQHRSHQISLEHVRYQCSIWSK